VIDRSSPVATEVDSSGVFERLLNPQTFTGVNRFRFDERGHGLGLEGSKEDETVNLLTTGTVQLTRDIHGEPAPQRSQALNGFYGTWNMKMKQAVA
jgi:hypothetical protein